MREPDHITLVSLDRRKLLLGLLFGSAAAISAWRIPRKHMDYLGKGSLDTLVPKTVGPWKFVGTSGLVVPPADQLSQSLYSNLLTRVYWNADAPPVMLLIAQSGGQTGILQVHRPEVCYPAGGYQLSPVVAENMRVAGKDVPTNRLTATADGQAEHILYWTRIGDQLPTSWHDQRLAVAEQNLAGIVPDAVLFRLSIRSPDAPAAFRSMEDFVRSLIAAIPAPQRRILIT